MENNGRKTAVISAEELLVQKGFCGKVKSVVEKRYAEKPLACVVTYGCQQNVADSEYKGNAQGNGLRLYGRQNAGTAYNIQHLRNP